MYLYLENVQTARVRLSGGQILEVFQNVFLKDVESREVNFNGYFFFFFFNLRVFTKRSLAVT